MASTKKPAPKKRPTARARAARKPAAKKPAVKKAAARKPAARKAAARKPAVKKPAAKKGTARKPAAKKGTARKPAAKRTAARRPAAKSTKRTPARASAGRKRPPERGGSGRPPGRAGQTAPPAAAPARKPIPFKKGDKVVYPHHGAATIIATEKRVFQGKKQDYFKLEVAIEQLTLYVPASQAVEQGVRPVISKTAARRVLAVFRTPPEEAGANWSRWYKLLTEKITSGDIYQVAEVVRDLTYAQQTKGISPALKRMLSKARLILASELRFALNLSEEDAMKRLDKALPRVDGAPEE